MLLHFFCFCLFEIGSSLVLRLIYKTLVFYLIFLVVYSGNFRFVSLCTLNGPRMETKRRNVGVFTTSQYLVSRS